MENRGKIQSMSRVKMDFNKYDESIISKLNRRKRQSVKKHTTIVGSPPPTGIHEEDRRIRDKRRNLAVKEILK